MINKLLILSICVFLIILDQFVKWWVIKYQPIFVYQNKGIIFGFIENQIISYLLLAIGFLILIWLIYKTRLSAPSLVEGSLIAYRLSLSLIVAGAISNLIDRVRYGYVIDYFNFFNLNHFNLADLYIIVGVLLYAFTLVKKQEKI